MSNGGILAGLRSQHSIKIAAILILLLVAAIVAANVISGIFALAFDIAVFVCGAVLYLTCDIVTVPPFLRRRHKPVPFSEGEAEGGKLEIKDGIPILTLRGANRQMGRQLGILAGEQLRLLVRGYLNYIFRSASRKKVALARAHSLEKYIPAKYLDEIRGISETSGVPYDELLLANTFTEDYRVFLCSTLSVRGKAAADGAVMMGRNLDFVSVGVLEHYSVIVVYHPEDGNAFAAMTYPGFIGAITGMNAQGLTSAMLISFSGGFSNEHMPSTIAFRMMLERCAAVEDATEFLKANPIAGPFNLSLVDAEGGMRVAELAHDHFALREPEDDVLVCTNRFYAGAPAGSRTDWRTRLMKGAVRNERGKFDVERMRRAMLKVYLFFVNVQCMVLLPKERVAHISFGKIPAAKGQLKRIDLKEYLR